MHNASVFIDSGRGLFADACGWGVDEPTHNSMLGVVTCAQGLSNIVIVSAKVEGYARFIQVLSADLCTAFLNLFNLLNAGLSTQSTPLTISATNYLKI